MHVIKGDFYDQLQSRLFAWIRKRPKLFASTRAGTTDYVITASADKGVLFDLSYFNEQYLAEYYSEALFVKNAELIIKEMAKVIIEAAWDFREDNQLISITVRFNARAVVKQLKLDNGKAYITL